MSTPAADGFRMPAEWAAHDRCWMAWPCRAQSWGGELEGARQAFAAVARAIAAFEPAEQSAKDHVDRRAVARQRAHYPLIAHVVAAKRNHVADHVSRLSALDQPVIVLRPQLLLAVAHEFADKLAGKLEADAFYDVRANQSIVNSKPTLSMMCVPTSR